MPVVASADNSRPTAVQIVRHAINSRHYGIAVTRNAASSLLISTALVLMNTTVAAAQIDYRNIDSGRPVRIGDATPTEFKSLELSLATARIDKLSLGRYRLQLEPRLAFGILPRTEFSMRAPVYFYERSLSPRAGVAGLGLGGEHQLHIESMRLPSVAIAGELFVPMGPTALRNSYSIKGLATRSFPGVRVHANASYGSFNFRRPLGLGKILPPLHGPCVYQTPDDRFGGVRQFCSTLPVTTAGSGGTAELGPIATRGQWIAGFAVDKTLPLRSLLFIADVYAQKYEGIGRPVDWTGEVGARSQVRRGFVVDAALGRLFTGESKSWFMTIGTTFSRPLHL